MPVINFKEITGANLSNGDQDSFELFAREFLKHLGYKIESGPDRGADGGRDLIVHETLKGIDSRSEKKWLVSCKHYAHSGKSVMPSHEKDIKKRLSRHECHGFIGFYSTLPSSGLTSRLSDVDVKIYDKEEIEKILLASRDGMLLCKRFFPASYKIWASKNPNRTIFLELPDLYCEYCGTSLLVDTHGQKGVVVLIADINSNDIENVYTSCNGRCDQLLLQKYSHESASDSWQQLSDLCISVNYLRYLMGILDRFYKGSKISEHAKPKLENVFINLFPYICREQSEEELSRIRDLLQYGLF